MKQHCKTLRKIRIWMSFFILLLVLSGITAFPVRTELSWVCSWWPDIWILEADVIACILVVPLAFVAGYIRQIPIGWRLIDCSFGVLGLIPLIICIKYTDKLEKISLIHSNQ